MALLLTPLQAFEQTASIQHHMFLRFLHSCTWLIRQRKEFPFLEGPPPLPTMAISFSEQTNSTKGLPSSLTILLLGKMVNIVPHTTLSKKIKVILERSPIDLPFQRLTDLSYVVTVTRCVARCTKEKTWQVLFVTNKSLSAEINLGTFETSQAWEYISETLRCFKCQRFSYHQTKCVASPLCAICAQPNAMEDCLAKHNAGEKTTIMHWTSVVKRGGHFYPWVLQYNESSQKKNPWLEQVQPTPIDYPYLCQLHSERDSQSPVTEIHSSSCDHHSQSAIYFYASESLFHGTSYQHFPFFWSTHLLAFGRSVNLSTLQILVDNVLFAMGTVTTPLPHPLMKTTAIAHSSHQWMTLLTTLLQ